MTSNAIFSMVLGHDRITERLRKALSERRPHALLFCGPSGVGKKKVALGWAQGLLCTEKQEAPCGKCSPCLRVAKMQHPDLILVGPGDSPTLKIEQIRDIQNFVWLKAFEGQAKIVIIEEAHTLTAQAGNALLKTLEEPPENSYFVLLTSNRGAVLSTIQSRCQRILFGTLEEKVLRKIVPDAPEWILNLSQGRADMALKLSDEIYKKQRTAVIRALRDLPSARLFEGFMTMTSLAEDRESSLFATLCFAQILKGAAAQKLGVKQEFPIEEKAALDTIIQSFSEQGLLDLFQKVIKLEQDIVSNVSKNLAFEKFFIDAKEGMTLAAKNP